jgi:hypothetical protein
MTRIATFILSLALVVGPALWLMDFSVPVPKYRKGGVGDYLFLGMTLSAVHGSVLIGVAVLWLHASRSGRSFGPIEVFMAGVFGLCAACFVFFGVATLQGIVKYGSFDKAIGNLWVVLAMFWGVLGALVAAGIALLFYAWYGPAGPTGGGLRISP